MGKENLATRDGISPDILIRSPASRPFRGSGATKLGGDMSGTMRASLAMRFHSASDSAVSQKSRGLRLLRAIPGFALAAALGSADAQIKWQGCEDLKAADFRKVVLAEKRTDTAMQEPVKMAIAPDGRIFLAERRGKIEIIKPGVPIPVVAWDPDVFWQAPFKDSKIEDGTLGIALDPQFAGNHYAYVYYSPMPREKRLNRLSRFTVAGDAFDTASEKVLLEVAVQRDYCCHTGGAMSFDANGNLYLTTGDNTRSDDLYGAIDERPNFTYLDAQRSAANTNDLRGKLLRIHPTAEGGYDIPAGNLKEAFASLWTPEDLAKVKPEIYSMGHRNPYTMTVDKYTGWALIGEVGPDADTMSPDKGPAQHEEFNLVRKAGNFGWPFLLGPNLPYRKFDYVAGKTGPYFDPANLMNTSVNNTGAIKLPPGMPALLSREFGKSGKTVDGVERWAVVQGTTAMTGPRYYYDGANASKVKLPPHFDKKWIMSDFGPGYLNLATLDDNGDKVLDVQRVPLGFTFDRPIAFNIGPDGALYVIEYAAPNFTSTAATKVSRIEYIGTCQPLTPVPTALRERARPGTADRGMTVAHAGLRVTIPEGSMGIAVYDLRGRSVWRKGRSLASGAETVALPADLPTGLFRILPY